MLKICVFAVLAAAYLPLSICFLQNILYTNPTNKDENFDAQALVKRLYTIVETPGKKTLTFNEKPTLADAWPINTMQQGYVPSPARATRNGVPLPTATAAPRENSLSVVPVLSGYSRDSGSKVLQSSQMVQSVPIPPPASPPAAATPVAPVSAPTPITVVPVPSDNTRDGISRVPSSTEKPAPLTIAIVSSDNSRDGIPATATPTPVSTEVTPINHVPVQSSQETSSISYQGQEVAYSNVPVTSQIVNEALGGLRSPATDMVQAQPTITPIANSNSAVNNNVPASNVYSPYQHVACSPDGSVVCIGESKWGLCNYGYAIAQDVAVGTSCSNGQIVKRFAGSRWMKKSQRI